MILIDKFNVIRKDQEITNVELDNYLENFIIQEEKLFSSNLIHNYLLNSDEVRENIFKKISTHLLSYLRQVINNWRKMKNKLDLNFINQFTKNYISKLKKLEIPFKILDYDKLFDSKLEINQKKYKLWGVSEILNIGIKLYCNKIISSQLTQNIIVDSLFDKEDTYNLIYFSKLMKDFNYYYQNNLQWFLNVIKDTYYDKIPVRNYSFIKRFTDDDIFINIYNFNQISNYYNNCIKNCKLLKIDHNKSCSKVFKIIEENLEKSVSTMINLKKYKILISFIKENKEIIGNIFVNEGNVLIKILSYIDKYEFDIDGINNLLNFYCILNDIILNNCILKSKSYQYVLMDKMLSVINKDSIYIKINDFINYLIVKYNSVLNSNNNSKDELLHEILDNFKFLIILISKTNNKDIFIKEYKKNLILRLSNNFDFMIEDKFYNTINTILTIKYLNSIKKIIYDYKISKKINNDFSEYNDSLSNSNYNVIMTSYGNWDISIMEGYYKNNYLELNDVDDTIDSEFKQFMIGFDYFYKKKYQDKRFLIWYPHLGKINIDIQLNVSVNIDLLPIQYQILDMIINKSFLDIEQLFNKLKNTTSYKLEFIQNLVSSLIKSEIVYLDYLKINNKELNSKTLYLNKNYEGKEYINLIDIFYSLSNISFNWEIKRKNEIVHERKTILMTIINSVLKYNKYKDGIDEEKLLEETNSKISLFDVDKLLLSNTLDSMIRRQFVSLSNNLYRKIIF